MHIFLYSFLIWLLLFIFGVTLCLYILPERLVKYSLLISPLFGYSLIIFISYYCYRIDLNGTNEYAWPVSITIFLLSVFFYNKKNFTFLILFNRDALIGISFTVLTWLFLTAIFFYSEMQITSLSLSNLDVAELAIESRFLQEFNRTSSLGFMGQTGWLKVVADDIWFGPSVIVSFISSLLKIEPYKAQTVMLHVLASQGAGIFYLLLKFTRDIDQKARLGFAFLYSISPIIIYTVWQSFGAQAIAIPIILLIFEIYLNLKNDKRIKNNLKELISLILLLSALLLTYHFIVIIIFMLIMINECASRIIKSELNLNKSNLKLLSLTLMLTIIFNPYRIVSIYETFSMVANSNNGWFIPWINPLTQLGFNSDKVFFGGYSSKYYEYLVYPFTILLALYFCKYSIQNINNEKVKISFIVSMFLPLFIVGFYYAITGRENGQLGGYRSFKINSIFLAFTYIIFSFPLTESFFKVNKRRIIFFQLLFVILVFSSFVSIYKIFSSHKSSIYILPKEVIEIQNLEKMEFISGLNILDLGNFTNLWANYFLLEKTQIYQKFPYGGRVVGELNQPFTLLGKGVDSGSISNSILTTKVFNNNNSLWENRLFALQDSNSKGAFTLTLGEGWWDREPKHQWSGRNGSISEIFLDTQVKEILILKGKYGKLRPNDSLQIFLDGRLLEINYSENNFISNKFEVNPGRHSIKFVQEMMPSSPSSHDGRTLGVLWKNISVEQHR